ncbi:MAG TPA: 4-hydroxyphenylacetate 3-hydroxylase N-terminal domain-containing protein, partial [Ilumatobacteraceae bacterium]|nr:4-hydroxyphenylacetate 3-hydroxylase N-terminal domain-containing protein [Ilumatobacteraceae bacterium]
MRTGADFLASVRDGRHVILDGEVVDDVSTHPAFSGVVHTMADMYDAAADPANRDLYTYPSPSDGSPVHTWWMIPRDEADLAQRRRAIAAWSAL